MPEFDRFDIAEAYWVYMAGWHNGGKDPVLALSNTFSRLKFKPRYDLSEETLSENGKEILAELIRTDGAGIRDRRWRGR